MVRIVRVKEVARRAVAVLPAIALATTGVALAAGAGVSSGGVPDEALRGGASPRYPSAGPPPAPMQLPPVYRTFTDPFPSVPVPSVAAAAARLVGGLAPVRIDGNGIPAPALAAYRRAAELLGSLDPACGLDWALLGAIGRVESNHARFGGNALDPAGVARPGIIGIPLDGRSGTARITDTDDGRWDRDGVYDRAVGPMQFIPGTWRTAGRDGDGDGATNPQSMADSAAAAGVYLCSGIGDLRDPAQARDAVLRYNHSDDYARSVLAIAEAYRSGVTVVPMSAIPAARPAEGSGTQTPPGSGFAWGGGAAPSSDPSSTRPSPTATASGSSEPTRTPSPTSSSPTADPAPAPRPSTPAPRLPIPTAQLPTTVRVPLPTLPVDTPLPSTASLSIGDLLALPHLPTLLGDPSGLVRVVDPSSGEVVCILDEAIVTCP
ncbi:lytic transglycosylase domain-containing protein [Intrasporangium calvum]|uniref:lytic transglycosylase domain-containing protein n=1 Tax=Intrasporangium calvum TaxID=53358 RepID=UPI001900D169|nr:lytic murein transglycosylase [Intrasporangium calvum]